MSELTPGDGDHEPDAEELGALFGRGVVYGRQTMKTDVLLAIGGCLTRDPTLQKLVKAIEDL